MSGDGSWSGSVDGPWDAVALRSRLAFSVQRLRRAAERVQALDDGLYDLRRRLEERACTLAAHAMGAGSLPCPLDAQIGRAQAQALADLAQRTALQEIARSEGRLVLVASMAISRWIAALRQLERGPRPEHVLRAHIEAGRVAYRMLVALRPRAGLLKGCGRLASAVVVWEFSHPDDLQHIVTQVESGLRRAMRRAQGVRRPEDAVSAAACGLNAGADILDRLASRAEPVLARLRARAAAVETEIEEGLEALADPGFAFGPGTR